MSTFQLCTRFNYFNTRSVGLQQLTKESLKVVFVYVILACTECSYYWYASLPTMKSRKCSRWKLVNVTSAANCNSKNCRKKSFLRQKVNITLTSFSGIIYFWFGTITLDVQTSSTIYPNEHENRNVDSL